MNRNEIDIERAVLAVTAAELVGVAGSHLAAVMEVRRLDGELVADLVLMGPVFAHSNDIAAELMANDGGIHSAVIGNALVVLALQGSLVGGHTYGVANNADLNIIRTNLGQDDIVQAQVILAVDSFCFGIHKIVASY